jgi:hypothetical protein
MTDDRGLSALAPDDRAVKLLLALALLLWLAATFDEPSIRR